MARPTLRTDELEIAIVTRLANGEPLLKISKDEDMPNASTVYRWLRESPDFARIYTEARQDAAHTYFDEAMLISDETPTVVEHEGEKVVLKLDHAAVARNKLRVHTRHQAAEKLLPRVYAPKVAIGGADDLPPVQSQPMSNLELARRAAFLFAKGAHEQDRQREPLRLAAPPLAIVG